MVRRGCVESFGVFNAMIPLDSPRWSKLKHCYGLAGDIPPLLRQLERFPASDGESEPWFTLWSSLCHQEDVFPASFAAVPHIVRVLATDPKRADFSFFQLPACIEIGRCRKSVRVPDDLRESYFEALRELPSLVGAAASRKWSEDVLCCALAAIAAAKGFPAVAEAVLELNSEVAGEFLTWFHEQ